MRHIPFPEEEILLCQYIFLCRKNHFLWRVYLQVYTLSIRSYLTLLSSKVHDSKLSAISRGYWRRVRISVDNVIYTGHKSKKESKIIDILLKSSGKIWSVQNYSLLLQRKVSRNTCSDANSEVPMCSHPSLVKSALRFF